MDGFDEGDQFDNLWINCWEDDALDQYENELDRNINEHLQLERDQSSQKLFQSFQSSACAVAQMFKDKMQPITPWNSFQNAAGAITVLYKDSLEACKVHLDAGVNIGQQRKVKELINWLRKKKRRNLRKDELISFLIGKQAPNSRLINRNVNRNETLRQYSRGNQNVDINVSTHSDLATFREALIMHNRTRDGPLHHHNHNHHHHHQHNHHQQQHNHTHSSNLINNTTTTTITQTNNINTTSASSINSPSTLFINNNNNNNNSSTITQQQSHNNNLTATSQANHTCDDLDCFFCEQIATHIEHKRSASSIEMDSPTRKRSRFY